jgi:hypothetical protein
VIREAQVGLHRMTRELREAHRVETPISASKADVWVPLPGGQEQRVSYECDQAHPSNTAFKRCLRFTYPAGVKSATGEPIVDRVLNGAADSTTPVFVRGAAPSTDYVKTTVEVAAGGDLENGYDYSILLEDGFYMRNLDG